MDENGQPIHLEPGNEFDFKIIKMNQEEKKVGLSIRAVGEEASRQEVEVVQASGVVFIEQHDDWRSDFVEAGGRG